MKLILNEKELVRKSLEEGFIDKKPTNTIKILIKYYFSNGMDKYQVRSAIDSFLKQNLTRYNPVKWDDILTKLVKKAEKDHKLIVIEKIHITNKELETIKNINNTDLEKLAFTYLVHSKIYNSINENESDWVNSERKEVFKDSKIATIIQRQRLMVNDLIELGLIESSNRRNCSNKKVLFVDHNGEPEIAVTDFREIALVYLKWKGESIDGCECCGRLFKVKNNKMKYCKKCAKDRKNELNKSYYHIKNNDLGK